MRHAAGHLQRLRYLVAWCFKASFSEQTLLCADVESEAQQEVLHSFGDAKGLTFSSDGKLLAVGIQDAVHIHEWPSLLHKASIRYAMHAFSEASPCTISPTAVSMVWLAW